MEKTLQIILNKCITVGFKLLIMLLILIIGYALIKFLLRVLGKSKGFSKLEKSVQTFILSFVNIACKVILFITILSYIGIPMTSMLALLGSCGIALGLALQGGLSNIAGGLMILLFKPFKVGEYISTHKDEGTVESITIFHTILYSSDNKKIVIPNGPLCNETIINYSSAKKRRLDTDIYVSIDNNVETIKEILHKIITNHKEIIDTQNSFVRLSSYDKDVLKFTTRVWVNTDDYETLKFNLLEDIINTLNKQGIKLPNNKVEVQMKK